MEQLASIPESMPKQSDLPLDDDGAEANNPEQPEAPTTDQDDFSDEANALCEDVSPYTQVPRAQS